MSCWTCCISVWAARITASSRVAVCSPNNMVRNPYSASPGPEPATTAPNPPMHSTAAAAEPTTARESRRRRPGDVTRSSASAASFVVTSSAIGVSRTLSRQPASRFASSASPRSVA